MRTLEEYQISSRTGFLLEHACSQLPTDWQAYDKLANSIVPLLSQPDTENAWCDFAWAISDLAVPTDEALNEISTAWSLETRCRLHLCLTCSAAAYLWHRGESKAPDRLPPQLARPLHCVSTSLGLQPTISHATMALANCELPRDNSTGVVVWSGRVEDLRLLCQPGPSPAFNAFMLITSAFELDFAKAAPLLLRCAESRCPDEVAGLLDGLSDCLAGMTKRFDDFSRLLNPDEFYRDVRPYFSGHEGLVFEGCSFETTPLRLSGGSAAQSAILQSVDAMMGIRHESAFMADMVNYMHPRHRQLLSDLAKETRVPQLLADAGPDSRLRASHSRAIDVLAGFRKRHIGLVSRYVVAPAGRVRTDFASLAELGTGGQPLIKFLKEVRDEGLQPGGGPTN